MNPLEYTFEYKAFWASTEQIARGVIKLKAKDTDSAYAQVRETLEENFFEKKDHPVIAIRLIGIQENLI